MAYNTKEQTSHSPYAQFDSDERDEHPSFRAHPNVQEDIETPGRSDTVSLIPETSRQTTEVEEDNPVLVPHTHGRAQIWDPQDVYTLWSQFRIVGRLVGALPRKPHQNSVMGLPLSLLKEEVRLMKDMGTGKAVTFKGLKDEPSQEIRTTIEEQREKCGKEQVQKAREQRKHEIELMADKILEGKRKKLEEKKRKIAGAANPPSAKCRRTAFNIRESSPKVEVLPENENNSQTNQKEAGEEETEESNLDTFPLTRESVIAEETAKIKDLPSDKQTIEVFTRHPLINRLQPSSHDIGYFEDWREIVMYTVFRNLWQRGFQITHGQKFGGDFLAYKGNPHLYHASFVVRCVESPDLISRRDLVAVNRVAASAKKTFVLGYLDPDSHTPKAKYRSFQWAFDDDTDDDNSDDDDSNNGGYENDVGNYYEEDNENYDESEVYGEYRYDENNGNDKKYEDW